MPTPEDLLSRQNIDFGNGLVFFAALDAQGAAGGERYVGASSAFALSITPAATAVLKAPAGAGPHIQAQSADAAEISIAITLQDARMENLGAFAGAEPTAAPIAAAATAKQLAGAAGQQKLQADRWYRLPGAEAGIAANTAVRWAATEAGAAAGNAVPEALIDRDMGAVFARAGTSGMPPAGGDLWARFTPAAAPARETLSVPADPAPIEAAVRFASTAREKNRRVNLWAPRARFRPAAAIALKSGADIVQIPLAADILTPPGGASPLQLTRVA